MAGAEAVKSCLDNGYKADTIKSLHRSGVNVSDYSDYGISNATYAETVKGLLNKGYKADNLKSMNKAGCSPDKIAAILKTTKGNRPDPSEYLSKEYIDNLLAQFKDGVSFVMTKDAYNNYVNGKPYIGYSDGTQFVMPKSIMDDIVNQADGDAHVYEEKLGFDQGDLENGGGLVRINVKNLDGLNLRIPSGKEAGANEHWIPGGYTSGGIPEAVTNNIPNNSNYVTITFLN